MKRRPKLLTDDDRAVNDAVFRRDGRCLVDHLREVGACYGPLTYHHLRKQGMGGRKGPRTEAGGIALCAHHNGWVEDHPNAARGLGLVVCGGIEPDEAAARRVAAGIVPRTRTLR